MYLICLLRGTKLLEFSLVSVFYAIKFIVNDIFFNLHVCIKESFALKILIFLFIILILILAFSWIPMITAFVHSIKCV